MRYTALALFLMVIWTHSTGYGHDAPANTIFVKAPVSMGNIGVQNLVVGISYEAVSDNEEILKSKEFQAFMNGIRVELQGIAMHEILSQPHLTLDTLSDLSQRIQARATETINEKLKTQFPDFHVAVPTSISRMEFYTTEQSTLSIRRNDF